MDVIRPQFLTDVELTSAFVVEVRGVSMGALAHASMRQS